jgi:hypothetical protein
MKIQNYYQLTNNIMNFLSLFHCVLKGHIPKISKFNRERGQTEEKRCERCKLLLSRTTNFNKL